MTKRKITNLYDVEFVPFDNYGVTVPGMSWHKISYRQREWRTRNLCFKNGARCKKFTS